MIEFRFGPKSKVTMKIARLENVPQSGTTAVSARPPAAQARGIYSCSILQIELCGVFCGHRAPASQYLLPKFTVWVLPVAQRFQIRGHGVL